MSFLHFAAVGSSSRCSVAWVRPWLFCVFAPLAGPLANVAQFGCTFLLLPGGAKKITGLVLNTSEKTVYVVAQFGRTFLLFPGGTKNV